MAEVEFKNIESIMDNIGEIYADSIRNKAIERGVFKTGRLARSYSGTSTKQGDKYTISIEGEYYGPFQSYGVGTPTVSALDVPDWISPPPTRGNQYSFKGGNKGIKARPFIEPGIDFINNNFLPDALEEAGVKDIEGFIDNTIKTLGKVK
jgi:hypothetical protein